MAIIKRRGWLLDLYPDLEGGLSLWLLGEDGERVRLRQHFPICFYAAGENDRLRALWRELAASSVALELSRTERHQLFETSPTTVLAVLVKNPIDQPALFTRISHRFPELGYFDADLPLALHHAARYRTFPLCRVEVTLNDCGWVDRLAVLDSPWDLDPLPVPMRVMTLQPDVDPRHQQPESLQISIEEGIAKRHTYRLALSAWRPLLINLAAILRRHDPDLLLTDWGDTWLLPYLLEIAEEHGYALPLNRDERLNVTRKAAHSYQAYGQVIHRGEQVQLVGRWHIDRFNAMMYHDYALDGIFESARVSGMPIQEVARRSPGSGISAMQIVMALRQGVLVPWHKLQAELDKSALDLLRADQGGLVYQPIIGLHGDVAEIDFISMYPSIMARFNVSPETIAVPEIASAPVLPGELHEESPPSADWVPELNLCITSEQPGLIPQTLQPLLDKRIALKERIAELPAWHPDRRVYKARAAAHKWLLVTCFGYLGYKNARFGRIEAHQAVTAYSRECLLRAKEAAEDAGYRILHMYVDGLWVQPEVGRAEPLTRVDLQPLLDEIVTRTRLPIALEGIYRWIAFLPSRLDERIPVANRYFGAFSDGSLKVRGIEMRRHDTPAFVARMQLAMLECMAEAARPEELPALLPDLVAIVRAHLRRLRHGQIPLEELLVTQKVSRELEAYRTPSPAARAARQLEQAGKTVRPGQPVKLIYTLGKPGVRAWDCPPPPDVKQVDTAIYRKLLLRAAEAIVQPLGVQSDALAAWVLDGAQYAAQYTGADALPLFSNRQIHD